MAVGAFWYSPVGFGKAWMNEVGMTEADLEGANPAPAMIKSFIAAIVGTAAMAILMTVPGLQPMGWMEGALLGLSLAVFIAGAGAFPNYAFEDKTLRHFLIHLGNLALAMTLTGAMLAIWR
jgi:hypothetical protein